MKTRIRHSPRGQYAIKPRQKRYIPERVFTFMLSMIFTGMFAMTSHLFFQHSSISIAGIFALLTFYSIYIGSGAIFYSAKNALSGSPHIKYNEQKFMNIKNHHNYFQHVHRTENMKTRLQKCLQKSYTTKEKFIEVCGVLFWIVSCALIAEWFDFSGNHTFFLFLIFSPILMLIARTIYSHIVLKRYINASNNRFLFFSYSATTDQLIDLENSQGGRDFIFLRK